LVELCAENNVTCDGLINGADDIFKDFMTTPQKLIWIDFDSPHTSIKTILKHINAYQEHRNIQNH